MYECFACLHVCAPHVCSACGVQQRVSDSLDLELQLVVVSCHVDAGN